MIKVTVLNNGVTVVSEKIEHVQSAAFGVWVRQGACDETRDVSGISHFMEHMMFKGTEKRSSREIAEDIDRIGGQNNAFTGKEATCYYVKTISENLEKGAEIILDMVNNSVFDQKELSRERQVVFEEMKMVEDQPDEVAHDKISELVFKGNPLGKNILGTKTALKNINHDVILNYKKNTYTRDSIVVSVAGNFDEDSFMGFLESQFDNLKDKRQRLNEERKPYKPAVKVVQKDIQQSHICIGTRSVPLGDDRYYALSLLNNIMGGTMSSRLFQNIREEKGLAYSVYSMNSSYSDDGMFLIYAGVSHDKIDNALEAVKVELDSLKNGGVSCDELEMAKVQMKSGYIFSQENVSSRMFANGKNLLLLGRPYEVDEIINGFNNCGMEELESVIPIISNFDNYSRVTVTGKK